MARSRPQPQPRPLNRLLRRIDPNRPERQLNPVGPRPPPIQPAPAPVIRDPNHPDFVIPRRQARGNEQLAAPVDVVVNPPAPDARVAARDGPAVVEVEVPRRDNVARRRVVDPDDDPSDGSDDSVDDDSSTGSDYVTEASTSSPSDSGSYTITTGRGTGVRDPNYVPVDNNPPVYINDIQQRPESWESIMRGPNDKTRGFAMTLRHTLNFTENQSWTIIRNIGTSAEAFKDMTETNLRSFCSQLAKTPGPDRLDLSMLEVNSLIGFMHWVQDQYRMGQADTYLQTKWDIEDLDEAKIELAIHRARIRENLIRDAAGKGKESSPGPLKSEKDWMRWVEKMVAYLDTQPGITGIPLSYVIRPSIWRTPVAVDDENADYLEMLKKTAPLTGPVFSADSRTVHQILAGFIVGQEAEHWVKGISSSHDGRRDMEALRFHYQGAANHTQRLAIANGLHRTLNYKSERQGKWESFLASCKYMFWIFEQHDEPMSNRAQVSFLLDKKRVTAPALQSMMDNLTADMLKRLKSENEMTFDEAAGVLCHSLANNTATDVAATRTVAAAGSSGGNNNNNNNNGGNSGGSGGRSGGKKGTKRGSRGGKRNGKRRKVAILGGEDIIIPGVGHIGDRGAEYAGLPQSIKDRIREERTKRGLQGGTSILRRNSAVTTTNSGSGSGYNTQRHVGAVSFAGETGSGGAFGGRAQAHHQRTEA